MVSNTNLATQRVSAKAGSVRSISSFNRPTNTTAYAANDVIFDTTAAGVIQFDAVGVSGLIRGVTCIMGETDTVNLELILFDAEPTNLGDNAALALVNSDMNKIIGIFTLADGNKKNVGTNREVYEAAAHDLVAYTSTDGKLFGILVTRSAFTPLSGAVFSLSLHIEADR